MPLTPRLGLYYPALSDDPDVPDDMRLLAQSVEAASIGWVAGDFKFSFQTADHDQFILCDGTPRNRAALPAPYTALVDAILGVHADPTKVKTPDFRRRSPMGAQPAGATIAGVVPNLGAIAGEEKHTLSIAEMPSHNHPGSSVADSKATSAWVVGYETALSGRGDDWTTNKGVYPRNLDLSIALQGSGTPFNVVQPVLFGNWFIATGGGGTGTGGGGGGGSLSAPEDVLLATANLAVGAGESGVITLGAGYRLLRVVSDQLARIRLYSTPTKRDADVARPLTVDPPDYPTTDAAPNHGVMAEINLVAGNLDAGSYVQDLAPNIIGSSGEVPRSNDIAYRVDNTGTAAHVINLTFTVQAMETV